MKPMDPLTHGVIGLAISAFSGDPVTLLSPISLGCALGAMSPDVDIVTKLKGDYVYLKYHRGVSHSIPALFILAGAITLGLSIFFQEFNFSRVFLWTLIGCFSHTFFDVLNSYGTKLFMPFSKKKSMVGILMLYDPVVTILCILLIFVGENTLIFNAGVILSFILYIIVRLYMKHYASALINEMYSKNFDIHEISVLPSLMAFHKWDFIVNTEEYHLVGQVNIITRCVSERKRLKKSDDRFKEMFDETNIGRYFKDFTPIYHIVQFEHMDTIILKSIDLRYYLNNNFMHHATAIYDKDNNVIESFFHPYNINKNIPVLETEL